MSHIAIQVENLSKRYVIGSRRNAQDGLRHRLEAWARSPWQWLKSARQERQATREEFWALRDVSFDIRHGEVIGIIGRNGAGKSTLLKILSRITEPTSGEITIAGRVASLLEVGTGFHPELTGRENIFLNGAILGMTRVEIKQKFDEIVAFSEVEKFLDTPVKRYSSGMYVRLAFAVAAHLEPEILIVDEVLAVGDAQFQKKCIGKIEDVSKRQGRTVLFVSHNLQTVRQMCKRVVVLERGKLVYSGGVAGGINRYSGLEGACDNAVHDLADYPRFTEHAGARLLRLEFSDPTGRPAFQIPRSADLTVTVHFRVERPVIELDLPIAIVHVEGQKIFSETYSDHRAGMKLEPGDYMVSFTLPLKFLKLESYFITVGLFESGKHCDFIEGLPLPEMVDDTADPLVESRRWGLVRIPVEWTPVKESLTAVETAGAK
jgi:lipopolysaccharide transport system ATP-binding protein